MQLPVSRRTVADIWRNTRNSQCIPRKSKHTSSSVGHIQPRLANRPRSRNGGERKETRISLPRRWTSGKNSKKQDVSRSLLGNNTNSTAAASKKDELQDNEAFDGEELKPWPTPSTKKTGLASSQCSHDIARTLKRINRTRLRARRDRIRLQEQSNHVRIKRDGLVKVVGSLQEELEITPPASPNFSLATILSLIKEVQDLCATLTVEDRKIEVLDRRLANRERNLDEAERDLLDRLSQEGVLPIDDNADDISESYRSEPISPRSGTDSGKLDEHVSKPSDNMSEYHVPKIIVRDRTAEDERHSGVSMDYGSEYEYQNSSQESWHPDISQTPNFEQGYPSSTDSDDFGPELNQFSIVNFVGHQFQSSDGGIAAGKQDMDKTGEEDAQVRKKRAYDLAPVMELSPLTQAIYISNIESCIDPDIQSLSLGHAIAGWILQLFACSWLELSRFLLFSEADYQLDKLTTSLGYIKLNSLICANWFRDMTPMYYDEEANIPPSTYSSLRPGASSAPKAVSHLTESLHRSSTPKYDEEPSTSKLPQFGNLQHRLRRAEEVSDLPHPPSRGRRNHQRSHSSRSSSQSPSIFTRKETFNTEITGQDKNFSTCNFS